MAIFILGIGIVSIAALFPAGIAQQRRSVDDVMGPVVANNAVSIIRRKVKPEDFGTYEEFLSTAPRPTVEGDWTWLRPAFAFPSGDIDIFNSTSTMTFEPTGLRGIPYNTDLYTRRVDARAIITQQERYYPQVSRNGTAGGRPQYVWECMFRRFQGRILVAVFVYRVTIPGGESSSYAVAANPTVPTVPPLPVWLALGDAGNPAGGWDADGPDLLPNTGDESFVLGTNPCGDYDPFDAAQGWQEAGQWLLDQNDNVHQVLSSFCIDTAAPRRVELVRPVPAMPGLPVFYSLGNEVLNIVSDIWYLPIIDANGIGLTPVYVTVKEL